MVSDTIDFALKAAWPFDKSGPLTPPEFQRSMTITIDTTPWKQQKTTPHKHNKLWFTNFYLSTKTRINSYVTPFAPDRTIFSTTGSQLCNLLLLSVV